MTNNIDLEQAAKTAIKMEEDGYAAYMSAANKSSNKLGKSTLTAIAEKELMHKAEIEKFVNKLTKKTIAGSNVTPDQKASEFIKTEIIAKIKNDLKSISELEGDLSKTYEISMGLETKGYEFYINIANNTDNQDAKNLFLFLAKEENLHYELLEDTHLYLTNPSAWFEKEEKWIVEG